MDDPMPPVAELEPDAASGRATPKTARRLVDAVAESLGLAFERASRIHGGERLVWDTYLMAAPNPMHPGQIHTGLAVFCSIPSTILGNHCALTVPMDPAIIDEPQEVFDRYAQDRLAELLSFRSEQQAMAQAAENGHQPPQEGLIVPGR
jgi:hypothetical protein